MPQSYTLHEDYLPCGVCGVDISDQPRGDKRCRACARMYPFVCLECGANTSQLTPWWNRSNRLKLSPSDLEYEEVMLQSPMYCPMYCPECAQKNPHFCLYCGADMSGEHREFVRCSGCSRSRVAMPKFVQGRSIRSGSFCTACGKRLPYSRRASVDCLECEQKRESQPAPRFCLLCDADIAYLHDDTRHCPQCDGKRREDAVDKWHEWVDGWHDVSIEVDVAYYKILRSCIIEGCTPWFDPSHEEEAGHRPMDEIEMAKATKEILELVKVRNAAQA